jgi:SAM-dependent methyltransferase
MRIMPKPVTQPGANPETKRYDRAYFDRWYRGQTRVHAEGEVRRKVALAIALSEYFLRRPLRSVLDVGCGEGAWLPHLRTLRPRLSYTGIDPSEYVVKRYGLERNIRRAGFAELASLGITRRFDLVICSDVLHYVPDGELRTGLPELARLVGGMAYLEILTGEDEIVGDLDGLLRRPAAFYRRLFKSHGLVQAGPFCWLSSALNEEAAELEVPG